MFAYDMAKLVADGLYSLAFLAIVLGLDLVLIAWMLVSPSSSRQLFWDMFLVTSIWGLAVYFSVKSFQTRIRKITSFDEYEKEIMGKIRKLGGKPEDLDKEETDIVKA